MSGPALIGKLRDGWVWLVDGLAEAVLWARERVRRAAPYRLEAGEGEARVLGPDGTRLGVFAGDGPVAGLQPPDLARRLAGQSLDIVVPPSWFFRRTLDPVAAQSRPFLDAFVRHQIERITPWRAEAVHHRVIADPLPGSPGRLAVSVVVVPKRLVARWLEPLQGLGLRAIRLRTAEHAADAIALGGTDGRAADGLRRWIAWGIAGLAASTVMSVGLIEWQAGAVRDDIDDQDRVLAERRVVLGRAKLRAGSGDDLTSRLLRMRDGRPAAVAIIDALATAVPDSAYLSSLSIEKDRVAISGLSTDASALVPALETSGRFADVAIAGPTTRTEGGDADRFSLSMRVLPGTAAPVAGGGAPMRAAGP